jgi:hypothetical protein
MAWVSEVPAWTDSELVFAAATLAVVSELAV